MPRGTKPYTINGKTYYPLLSAQGFSEHGIASWYGPDFHGKQTANGEVYNMHGMTAAHKLLPFDSKVRVTNQNNGKSIYVRINDRGPFVDDRIIDLTHEGAKQLDILGKGTAPVLIEVVSQPNHGVLGTTTAEAAELPAPTSQKTTTSGTYSTASANLQYYVQVGAFGDKANAQRLVNNLKNEGRTARVVPGMDNLWKVQVGPFGNVNTADGIAIELAKDFPNNFTVAE